MNCVERKQRVIQTWFMVLQTIVTTLSIVAIIYVYVNTTQQIAEQQKQIRTLQELITNHIQWERHSKLHDKNKPKKKMVEFQLLENPAKVNSEMEDGHEDVMTERYKRATKRKCCAAAKRGNKGQKGSRGRKGRPGYKGEKGERGPIGPPGAQDDSGSMMKDTTFSQSAHVFGHGKSMIPTKTRQTGNKGRAYILTSWIKSHSHGAMIFNHNNIEVAIAGYYYIYGQMEYRHDGQDSMTGFMLCIDNVPKIEASNSIVKHRRINTNYIGGVFFVKSGQKISMRTEYLQKYYFSETRSFFGAFLIHK